MAVVVVFVAFALLLALWHGALRDCRATLLAAAASWAGILVAMTEALSVITRITFAWTLAGWIVVCVILAALLWRRRKNPAKTAPAEASPKGASTSLDPTAIAWALLTPLGIIGITLAVVALRGPPNNYDAMVYHLPRVLHWIENHNVAFYPTAIARQLDMPPGAEFIVLHLQLLRGNDQLTDMSQWFAWIGCIVAASLIARELGAGIVGQSIAALAAGTLPMACLQAVTAQNDLIASLWIATFFWLVLRTLAAAGAADAQRRRLDALLCGLALGLAMLTKSTDYLYAAPAVVALTIGMFWVRTWRALLPLAAVASLALLLNAPTYLRNYRFTGNPLGTGGQVGITPSPYVNARRDLGTVVSNYLRNAGLEVIVPSESASNGIEHVIRIIHRWLGLNPDDTATTWQLYLPQFQLRGQLWDTEDDAGNPIQSVLIAAATVLILCHCRTSGRTAIYGAGLFVAATAFCYELRWQPWHTRLHLPLMIAAAPIVGVALERHMNRKAALVIAVLLPWLSIPVIARNYNHPLTEFHSIFDLNREMRYFIAHPGMRQPFEAVVKVAEQHHIVQVGLITGENDCEYPLDVMLQSHLPAVRIDAYPDPHTLTAEQVKSRNQGFDANVRPYMVVRINGESATVEQIAD